jgi:hypothetical protein
MSSPAYSAVQIHMLAVSGSLEEMYQEALRNPALWVLLAEERIAFNTSITLIEGPVGPSFFSACFLNIDCDLHTFPADYSRPVIVPFRVAMPNINFPPGQQHSDFVNGDEM